MMDRFSKLFCDPVKLIKFIAVLLVSVGILVYVYLQTLGGVDSEISTETSMYVTMNDAVAADAYIFRDETVVGKPGNGTVVTLVSEGDRVSKGQMIAKVFSDAQAATLQDDINRVQRRLDILNDSAMDAEFVVSDLAELDSGITESLADIYSAASDGNLASVIDNSSDLLVKLNKRDLIVDSGFDYTGEQQKLLSEKNELEARISSISSPIYASSSGYFYGGIDGYENTFDIKLVDDMSLDSLERLSQAKPDDNLLSDGGLKIVNDFIWYTVCSVDAEKASGINEGKSYTLSFPESGDAEIDMKLERIVKETNSAKALAIFRVNVLPSGFDYKRFQTAEIVLGGIEGLSVPKKALRVINGVEGVYILVGDVIRFRRVERIAEKEEYYVVRYIKDNDVFDDGDENAVYVKPLELYDNIVVSGKDLFDGKIVG